MNALEILLKILQVLLSLFNICVLLYAFKRFLSAPRDSLSSRVIVLETEVKELKEAQFRNSDKFKAQDATNEVLIRSSLALISFEMQYCLTENKPVSKDLEKAKEDLNNYLSKR